MDCSISTFISKLNAIGYTTAAVEDNAVVLKGDFAGKTDCSILVLGTAITKQVWKVCVIFPEKTSWGSLKNEYKALVESYTAKYGTPQSYAFFSKPYYEGDGYELQAVKLNKCTYSSFYKVLTGDIAVSIDDSCSVMVVYEDGINSDVWSTEKENVVSNDI